jgi:two-component sensor histidine kinase
MPSHGVHHATAESVRRAFSADLCTIQIYRNDGGITPVFHTAGAGELLPAVIDELRERIGYDVIGAGGNHHRRRGADRVRRSVQIDDGTLLLPLIDRDELLGHLIVSGIGTRDDDLPRFVPLLEHTVTTIATMERDLLRLREQENDHTIHLQEAHHRMKNSLQTVTGLLSMQAEEAGNGEVSTQLRQAAERVEAIQDLYEHLAISADAAAPPAALYLDTLVASLIDTWRPEPPVSVAIDAGDLELDPKILGTIGSIVNELATNALNHAYRDIPDPRLTVTVRPNGSVLEVVVGDNGCGLPDTFDPFDDGTTGLGTQIVRHLVEGLDGTVTYRSNPGTEVTIAIPFG